MVKVAHRSLTEHEHSQGISNAQWPPSQSEVKSLSEDWNKLSAALIG